MLELADELQGDDSRIITLYRNAAFDKRGGCNGGMVSYDIPSAGLPGEVPIQRIALDNVAVCESLSQ